MVQTFKLAIITSISCPLLKTLEERKLSAFFSYTVIDSLSQLNKLPMPLSFVACLCAGFDVPEVDSHEILEQLIDRSPDLRWVHMMTAGVDYTAPNEKLQKAQQTGKIVFTNSKGAYNQSIAEFVAFGILYFAKRAGALLKIKQAHKFDKVIVDPIQKKTVGIIGYGSIGRTVARILRDGFDMKILAITRSTTFESLPAEEQSRISFLGHSADLCSVLSQSDFVVNILPLTPDTTGLFTLEMFRNMKHSAVFINIGRGRTVVEVDLIQALKEGAIAGAALDVFEQEPLPSASPLYSMENVFVSAHTMGETADVYERCLDVFQKEMANFVQKKPLRNVVDLLAGY